MRELGNASRHGRGVLNLMTGLESFHLRASDVLPSEHHTASGLGLNKLQEHV